MPKTEIIAGVDGIQRVIGIGAWVKNFEAYHEECKNNPDAQLNITLKDSISIKYPEFKIQKPFIVTRSVADIEHRYLLDVDFDMFSSFNHAIELTDSGILMTADSTVNNVGVEVFKNTLTTIKDIAVSVASVAPFGMVGSIVESSESCNLIFTTVNAVLELENIEKEREAYVLDKATTVRPETLAKAMTIFDSKIAVSKTKNEKYLKMISQEVKKYQLRYIATITPKEFQEYGSDFKGEVLKIADGAELGIPKVKILANEKISKIVEDALSIRIYVTPDPDNNFSTVCANMPDACKDDNVDGYRYRIPVTGKVTMKNKGNIMAESTVNIAQYGPIAALPTKISGLEGSISLSVYSDTGALKRIVVGAKSLPSSMPSDLAGIGTDFITQRREAHEAAVEKAENLELDTVLKENELLAAKKKNAELKASLGIEE